MYTRRHDYAYMNIHMPREKAEASCMLCRINNDYKSNQVEKRDLRNVGIGYYNICIHPSQLCYTMPRYAQRHKKYKPP